MTTTTSAPATRLLDMEDASVTLPLKSFIHRESPKDHGGGNHTPLSQDHSPRYNGSGYTSQLQRPSPQYSASISPVNPTFTVDQSTDCSVSASGSDHEMTGEPLQVVTPDSTLNHPAAATVKQRPDLKPRDIKHQNLSYENRREIKKLVDLEQLPFLY